MHVGVLREIKADEYRVSLTPAGVRELVAKGHSVLVQRGAGLGSSFSDEDYAAAGATIAETADEVFMQATLLLKVKEPLESEYLRLRPQHILFTYLHLAPDPKLTQALVESGASCVAYETVESAPGVLPLLTPMSEVAGRLAPHTGAYFLERMNGGKGKLLGGVTGVAAAKVVVLGAGTAGTNAAQIALGMHAHVTLLDTRVEPLLEAERFLPGVETLMSNQMVIEDQIERADLAIGAVLVPGGRAPRLVSRELVAAMQPGSVVLDMSVDQGGCFETSRMTTHTDPTYVEHGVVHYCVGNMPGAVPITSTLALTNATLPYVVALADKGLAIAARDDPALAKGVNVTEGKITNTRVAQAVGGHYFPLGSILPIEYT